MNLEQKNLLKVWIAACLWMGLIALESTKYFGAGQTSRLLFPIFHFLFGMTWKEFQPWHFVLRKTGHFVGYFMLSVLAFRAWKATFALPRVWAIRWAGIGWLMSAIVASLDEWHQTYLPNRTGTIDDVILDSTAALVAQIVIFIYFRAKAGQLQPEEAVVHGD